jgi:hypothetical protein
MTIKILWILLLAGCGAAAVAFSVRMRRQRHDEKQVHKADIHEWENEGGNLAPSPEAPATVQTKGSV